MNNLSIFDRKKRISDKALNFLIQFCSALSVLILVVCIGYILYRCIPYFDFSYLVNTTSILKGTIGILPNIINTLPSSMSKVKRFFLFRVKRGKKSQASRHCVKYI